jgi:hypothetical protein
MRCFATRTPGVEVLEDRFLLSVAASSTGAALSTLSEVFLSRASYRSEVLAETATAQPRGTTLSGQGPLAFLLVEALAARQAYRELGQPAGDFGEHVLRAIEHASLLTIVGSSLSFFKEQIGEHVLRTIEHASLLTIVGSSLPSAREQTGHGTAARDDAQTSAGSRLPPAPEGSRAGDTSAFPPSPSAPQDTWNVSGRDLGEPSTPLLVRLALAVEQRDAGPSPGEDRSTSAEDLEPDSGLPLAGRLPVDLKPLLNIADAFFEQLGRLTSPRESQSLLSLAPWLVAAGVTACELVLLPGILRRSRTSAPPLPDVGLLDEEEA